MGDHRPSPLRYPGGKSAILPMVGDIIVANDLRSCAYAEPYAGGGGLALRLLFEGLVSDVYLNDIDPGIFAFWQLVLFDTDWLLNEIKSIDISIDEWQRQRAVLDEHEPSHRALGFASFYMNRTNRSGIISGAGPIGGFDQTGKYLIDCRFNRDGLSQKITRIAKYSSCIKIYNLDAEVFMKSLKRSDDETILFCIDPPYFNKGSSLYTSFYRQEDHASVAETVSALQDPWIVTYDNAPQIRSLYADEKLYSFDINYSVQTKRVGKELLIASHHLQLPPHSHFNLRTAA